MRDNASLAKTRVFPNEGPVLQTEIVVTVFHLFLKKDIIATISML